MRIHTGLYKNKKIKRVGLKSTRETSSIVRESIFNMLFSLEGKVLDLFAGSGSYGLTSLSMGAEFVVFVDNNQTAISTVLKNVKSLDVLKQCQIIKSDYLSFLNKNEVKFDYIFLDPPYNFKNYNELIKEVINKASYENTKIIVEVYKDTLVLNKIENFYADRVRKYGNKKIIVYKSINNE